MTGLYNKLWFHLKIFPDSFHHHELLYSTPITQKIKWHISESCGGLDVVEPWIISCNGAHTPLPMLILGVRIHFGWGGGRGLGEDTTTLVQTLYVWCDKTDLGKGGYKAKVTPVGSRGNTPDSNF